MLQSNHFNSVFDNLEPSPTLYINETVNQMWQQGKSVFHMGFGESRFSVHPKLQQALADSTHHKSYLTARGLPELCESVASYYTNQLAHNFKQEQVIIGPGSKAIIYSIIMALDADVLLPTPSWVSYQPQAELLGKNVFYIPASARNGYQLTIDNLQETVNRSTNPNKLLIINSPNNPTGQMLDDNFLQDLAKFCRNNNIFVLSDEIYFRVSHPNQTHTSIAKFYPEATLVLGGLSKHLSLGGWRIGVGLVPKNKFGKNLMQSLTVIASEIWSAVVSPIQYAAIAAYSSDRQLEDYVNICSTIHGIRSRYIYKELTKLGITSTQPQGAFYLTVNFDEHRDLLNSKGITNSVELANHLLTIHSIATLPGSAFGIPEQELSLRLSTSYLDFETDQDSQRLLDLYRSEISEDEFMSEQHHPNTHGAIQAFADFLSV